MKKFTSDLEAKKVAEQISKNAQVFIINDGLEVSFTSEVKNQKEIVVELKKVFSDVSLKGRKVPYIVIKRKSQLVNGFRITEVTY
jgi:hypothetical protein